jgi:hypothetical protein
MWLLTTKKTWLFGKMIHIFALLAITATEVHTIRYFSTHSECLVEKYKVEEKINNPSVKFDCIPLSTKGLDKWI